MFVFFFFSSRRRHTRCSRDWSSDVCSNSVLVDLKSVVKAAVNSTRSALIETLRRIGSKHTFALARRSPLPVSLSFLQIYHQRWYIYYRRMAWQNSLHLMNRRQLPGLSPTRFERTSKKYRVPRRARSKRAKRCGTGSPRETFSIFSL